MRFPADFAWRDLRATGGSLWIFCLCLALGVTLIAATGGLYRLVSDGLLADTRALLGGDLEVEADAPLPAEVLAWMRARGRVSRLTEMHTMLGTEDGRFRIVELQSVDDAYPLYGTLQFDPAGDLAAITAQRDGAWGVAVDPVLADRLALKIGDRVHIGTLTVEVRARIRRQPDRSLRADWRGPPVFLAPGALAASGLVRPSSRIDYDYRVRTELAPETWRQRFLDAFPGGDWEIHTFRSRSERLAERLNQIASAFLIIALSTLFIGGLGVFNSIQAYLQGKLDTIATLRSLGLRDGRLAAVYLLQVGMLSAAGSLAGALAGGAIALAGALLAAAHVPVAATAAGLLPALLTAVAFGLLTGFTFALPALGRALAASPAALFRGAAAPAPATPRSWRAATLAGGALIVGLILLALPDPLFGAGFVLVVAVLLGLLDGIVRGLRRLARGLGEHPVLAGHFPLRLAVANLHRPGSPLRTSLLSLGSALTLLVVCALVVGALVRAINDTIPEEAPALVLYDIAASQRDAVVEALRRPPGAARVDTAPLVQGRVTTVNGQALRDSPDPERRRQARDEQKLSYLGDNIDNVTLIRGRWWRGNGGGTAKIAVEDREAGQIGLEVGDRLTFDIAGRTLQAEVAAIYRQKGIQTRFWFEGIVSDGALDPFIHRYVGAAYLPDAAAVAAQQRVAGIAPNVVSVRTASILKTARELLGKASAGLAVVAAVSLLVSLLVLGSVMATSRTGQIYAATVLYSLGARLASIRRSLALEYLLLAVITTIFASAAGAAIALPLLIYRLKLPAADLIWLGVLVAAAVSSLCLALGAQYLFRRLRVQPAVLLRSER